MVFDKEKVDYVFEEIEGKAKRYVYDSKGNKKGIITSKD